VVNTLNERGFPFEHWRCPTLTSGLALSAEAPANLVRDTIIRRVEYC
jgi:hypothetical protein